MKIAKIAATLLGVLILSACGGTKTVQIPPEELTTYPAQVTWKKNWSLDAGAGDGEFYTRLQPGVIPAVTDGRVFTADHKGNVMAFSIDEQPKRIWDTHLDDVVVTGGVGVGSGLVLIGTQKGILFALSQNTGEIVWRTALSSEILSAPQSDAGVVVVLTEDSRLYGLDAKSGKINWRYNHTAPLLQLRGSAPVIIDDGIVYAGFANGFVVALNLESGALLWQEAVSYPRGRSEIDRVVDVNGRMAVHDGVLYVVNYQGRAIAIDVEAQNLLWEKELSSYSGLSVNQDAVFITDDESRIWALDRHSGDTLWQQLDLRYRQLTAPSVYKNAIAVGDFEGYVHLIRASNGQLMGRIQVDSDPIHTPPITMDDSIFVLTSDGELARLTPTPVS
jgi:outer membrane protein assembly factor BamB